MMKPSKIKTTSLELLRKRFLRDEEEGGISSITISPPGEGKTNQLIHDAFWIFKHHPNEICFWRDNPKSAAQYNKEGVQWEIFVEKGCNIKFHNLSTGGDLDIKYTFFDNFEEIINKDTGQGMAKPQQLNVLYFKEEYTWIDFIDHLRHTIGWQNIFIDEIEDLIPLNPPRRPGEERNIRYEKNLWFAENFKELRKGWVNFFSNTQDLADIEPRVRRKINFIVYLSGARVEKKSKVKQGSVNHLRKGYSFMEWEHSKYGKINFDYYPNKNPYFEVIIE